LTLTFSNSSERGTNHVLPVNLAQIHSDSARNRTAVKTESCLLAFTRRKYAYCENEIMSQINCVFIVCERKATMPRESKWLSCVEVSFFRTASIISSAEAYDAPKNVSVGAVGRALVPAASRAGARVAISLSTACRAAQTIRQVWTVDDRASSSRACETDRMWTR